MLILLPPSEGKTSPTSGPTLDLGELSFPGLTAARRQVIQALRELGDGAAAAAALKLGKKSAADAALNLQLESSACAPAVELFTGVLYDHLDAATLDGLARERLAQCVWMSTALFGFVRPADLIPNYRLAAGVRLPELGPVNGWWRAQFEAAGLIEEVRDGAVVDLRSGGYRAMFPVTTAHAVELAVVEERPRGRQVITHMAKKWRGIAARHLLSDPALGAHESAGDRAVAGVDEVDSVVDSLRKLAASADGVLGLEAGTPQPTKAGGSRRVVTLVTASTA